MVCSSLTLLFLTLIQSSIPFTPTNQSDQRSLFRMSATTEPANSLPDDHEAATTTTTNPRTVDDPAAVAAIAFAKLVGKLKTTPRTGWVRRGVPRYESVADHSWRVAALSLIMAASSSADCEPPLDIGKCMQFAVVHDMAESIIGDITPEDNVSKEEKQRMELVASQTIAQTLGGVDETAAESADKDGSTSAESYLMSLFHDYELRESREAKIVKDLDLMDMLIQADEYEERFGTDLSEFFKSTPPARFGDPFMKRIAEQVHSQRNERSMRQAETERAGDETGLSIKDQAFADEFSQASTLNAADIRHVVKALRGWEQR